MPVDESSYTDARLWVREKLIGDPDLIKAYRQRFDTVARRAFDLAASEAATASEKQTRGVFDRYTLTRAGFDSGVRLAGLYLERGDAEGSAAVLRSIDSHPDLDNSRRRYLSLLAYTEAQLGEKEALNEVLSELRAVVGGEAADSLARSLDGIRPNRQSQTLVQNVKNPKPPLSRPLWQAELEQTATTNRVQLAQRNRTNQSEHRNTDLLPVSAGPLLLLNDNDRVYAIDRISGRARWGYQYSPTQTNASGRTALLPGRVLQDRRKVLVRGQQVFAVLGFSVPWQGRNRQLQTAPTQLISLDRETGQELWAVTPGELDANLDRAAFHGTPLALGNLIIVMARRSQASSFQDSYLFAVDAATGELRWRRHLASTAGSNDRNAPPPVSSMSLEGEIIYFCDNLGAAAAVDGRSGSVYWVRQLIDEVFDVRRRGVQVMPFSDVSRPAICGAGLIIPMRVRGTRGLLLDPENGAVLREFTAGSPFAEATDVRILDDGDVLVVGPRLARLDGQNLTERWSNDVIGIENEGLPTKVSVRFRTAIVSHGTDGLREIDTASGRVVAEHSLPWNGSVLAVSDAWVVISGRKLGGYIDWPVAYSVLKRRSEEEPYSPYPGLNMAILAFNAGQPQAADEGVERSLRALATGSAGRESPSVLPAPEKINVFEELLGLLARVESVEAALLEKLFDRIAAAAETPAELLAYNVARGDFLVDQKRFEEAAAYYQAVLSDPRLAEESLTQDKNRRRGDVAVRSKLIRLAERHGSDFYRRFDLQAEQELTTLLATPTPNVNALLRIARRYPLARVRGEAIFYAAKLQAKSDTPVVATTQFRRAFQLADEDGLRGRAAGALAELYNALGRPSAAARWLEQVRQNHPDLKVIREGLAVDPQVWLESLASLPQSRSDELDVTPPFSESFRVSGRLVPTIAGKLDRSGGLLYEPKGSPGTLALFDAGQRIDRWSIRPGASQWRLVDQRGDQLVLGDLERNELLALDTVSGQELWPAIRIQPLLDDLGKGGLAEARKENAGGLISIIEADFRPINQRQNRNGTSQRAATLPPRFWASEAVIGVVDHKGRAFGLDRTSGQVLWQTALPLDTTSHVNVIDDVLAVAGTVSPGTESQSGRFMLIDLATGLLRFPAIEEQNVFSNILFSPGGDPVLLSSNQLVSYDRRNGAVAWRIPLEGFGGTPRVVAAGDTLFVHGRDRLISVDLGQGEVVHESVNLAIRRNTPTAVAGREGMLFTLKPEASFALDKTFSIRWQDGLSNTPKNLLAQVVTPRYVLVLDRPPEAPRLAAPVVPRVLPDFPEAPALVGAFGQLRLSALDRETGRIIDQTVFRSPAEVRDLGSIEVLNNALLISGQSDFVLIPGRVAQ
ncbi:MAG: PQQ-binding-like beta-propeller repeat protein [Planctomycetota bacterium]